MLQPKRASGYILTVAVLTHALQSWNLLDDIWWKTEHLPGIKSKKACRIICNWTCMLMPYNASFSYCLACDIFLIAGIPLADIILNKLSGSFAIFSMPRMLQCNFHSIGVTLNKALQMNLNCKTRCRYNHLMTFYLWTVTMSRPDYPDVIKTRCDCSDNLHPLRTPRKSTRDEALFSSY